MKQTSGARAPVLLVDDHPLVRQGLRRLIEGEPDLRVCAEAGDMAAALKGLETEPELAVVDLSLGAGGDGLELVRRLKRKRPRLRILVLSVFEESRYAERALRAGACGYIMKDQAPEHVLDALRRVLRDGLYLSDKASQDYLTRLWEAGRRRRSDELSARELAVYQRIGEGRATRDIAAELGLSAKTVDAHRENIKRKLGLRTAAQLARAAFSFVEGERPERPGTGPRPRRLGKNPSAS